MTPLQLLQTIYLGDRCCKAVLIDSWNQRVAIQVTNITRLKPDAKTWDFYTDADIKDGWLVFTNVRTICFKPAGAVPNDLINEVTAKAIESSDEESNYLFQLSIDSVNNMGSRTEVLLSIEAGGFHLEDPAMPGVEIRT